MKIVNLKHKKHIKSIRRSSVKMWEKSVILKVFGDSPLIRVLDFFLTEGLYFDYSLTDIAKHSGVSWRTLHLIMPRLVKLGIVRQTRTIARAKLFALNKESPTAKRLLALEYDLAAGLAEEAVVKQKVTVAPKIKH